MRTGKPLAEQWGPDLQAFWISLGVIFLAELGDKSQLMALAFAARFKATTILLAITIATALVHLASVLIGSLLGGSDSNTGDHHRRWNRISHLRGMDNPW